MVYFSGWHLSVFKVQCQLHICHSLFKQIQVHCKQTTLGKTLCMYLIERSQPSTFTTYRIELKVTVNCTQVPILLRPCKDSFLILR